MNLEMEWKPLLPHCQGRLIVIEGGDGSGKTTQISQLASRIDAMGFRVTTTRQPTDWYRKEPIVRLFLDKGGSAHDARVLALLAAADRLRHCLEVIEPALESFDYVICDRYVYSSLVYFELRGVSQKFVAKINAGIPRPHLSLYLDVPPKQLACRIEARDGERRKFEERSLESISSIRQGFLTLSPLLERIDGEGSKQEVADQIWATLEAKQLTPDNRILSAT